MSAKCYRWVGAVSGVILLLMAALSVNAQASVTVVTASANPTSSSGPCPATFTLSAIITSDSAGTVAYRWERSGGGIGPTTTLTFSGAGSQTVTTTWTLGPSGTNTFWEQVHVLSPNETFSNQASFTLTCGGGGIVTGVTASVSPTSSSGPCPASFSFAATITVNSAGTVTYRWERSDGGLDPTTSITFSGAGSQTVTTTWTLGPSGTNTYWEQVHVLSPNDTTSNQASFTLSCGGGGGGTFSLDLHAGWNMISSPVGTVELSSIQGDCSFSSGPWWWNGTSYQIATMIEPAKGYWVLTSNPCTMQAFGNHTSEGLILVSGWNMISSSGSWTMMNTGGCSLISGLWWYDGSSYQLVSPDAPMDDFKGYWAKVSDSCGVTSQTIHNAWHDSLVPPGPPTIAPGLFMGLLNLLGLRQTIAAPQPSLMPLVPNEIRLISAHTGQVELQIKGQGILSSRVRLYTLSGQLVAEAEGTGNLLRFSPLDSAGRPLANGVYLYVVTVRGAGGEVVQSELRKLILLR